MNNNPTPILPFIQEKLKSTIKEIKADLFLWLSGKKHPNLQFSGSLRDKYWGPYLDEHVQKIIDTAFATNKEIATEHGLDPSKSVNDGTIAAEQAIKELLNLMADYDRRMRGKGYRQSVPLRDITEFWEKSSATVRTRAENEFNLLTISQVNIFAKNNLQADSKSIDYVKMIKYLTLHNAQYRSALILLGGVAISSLYGIWNFDYNNLLDTKLLSDHTKQEITKVAPNIIIALFLSSFLILNKIFIKRYDPPSKLSKDELEKFLDFIE